MSYHRNEDAKNEIHAVPVTAGPWWLNAINAFLLKWGPWAFIAVALGAALYFRDKQAREDARVAHTEFGSLMKEQIGEQKEQTKVLIEMKTELRDHLVRDHH